MVERATSSFKKYSLMFGVVGVAAAIRLALSPVLGETGYPFISFFPAIAVIAHYAGYRAALGSILLSAAAAEYFFVAPIFSFRMNDWGDAAPLLIFLMLGFLIAWVTETARKSAAKAAIALEELERARNLAAVTLSAIGDAVITTDAGGSVNFMNHVAESLSGWRIEDAKGRPLSEVFRIFNEHTGEEIDTPVTRVLREGRTVGLANHTVLVRKDGTRIPIADTGAPIMDRGSTLGAVLVFRDVSEARTAQAEIDQSRQRLASLLQGIPDGFAAYDREWRLTYLNDQVARMTGKPRAELLGRSLWDLFPDLAGSEFEERARECIESREARLFQYRYTALGSWFEIACYPTNDGAILLTRDVTERMESERLRGELFKRVEEQAALLHLAYDGILALQMDGTIEFWNRGAERMYGYTAEEAMGRKSHDLLKTRYSMPLQEIEHILLNGGTWEGQLVHTRKDGTEIDISTYWAPRMTEGRVTGILEITRDITEQKRLQEQLQQAAKLESLGVLAGGIAHDFNNLLVGIMGNASLALENITAANPNYPLLKDVVAASERAADLTRQLLAYAGKGRFITEMVNLSDVVNEVSALIQAAIPKNVELDLVLQRDIPLVDADVSQMQQVIMNLVINGAEAVEKAQGSVTVTTRIQEVDELYLTTLALKHELKPGTYVAIEVHDTGSGMDEERVARIFDPFFTTKFQGRGLGLAAVQGIIRSHKGGIKVYTAPGQGTSFKVLLPAAQSAKPAKAPVSAPRESLHGEGLVLVVDDEAFVRQTAKNTLERYGYQVLTAKDGREGVELFRANKDLVRLVLLDLTMPVMGGEDALRGIKSISPAACVILSSGFSELEAVHRFSGKGLAGFIQKPYTASALGRKVKDVLDADMPDEPASAADRS
jgi:PAS domain S-box-containing protein